MTVEDLPGHLQQHWPTIRASLRGGTSRPRAVKRVERPKPGGGVRTLGLPTVLDRLLQQALRQVWQPAGDQPCSEGSDGLRPGRSAHQASARAQASLEAGYRWVVALDVEQGFDRVHHDTLMRLVKERGKDRRVVHLLVRSLQAGALPGDGFEATLEGTPQGGPWSPLVATLLRDGFEQEVARRGHRFVRDAAASTISVQSARAGHRGLARVRRC